MIAGIFISAAHDGQIYTAERSRKGSVKLLWVVVADLAIPDLR
jgi:hypothetical protein